MRCPVHLSIGQEAVAAGVAAALDRDRLGDERAPVTTATTSPRAET